MLCTFYKVYKDDIEFKTKTGNTETQKTRKDDKLVFPKKRWKIKTFMNPKYKISNIHIRISSETSCSSNKLE